MPAKKYDSVLVLSGGIDSTVLAYQLTDQSVAFRTIYLDFGKAVSKAEISCVKRLTVTLGIPLDVVDVSGITALQRGYISDAQVLRDEADVKDYEAIADQKYVSGFHILVSIAAYYAQIVGSPKITLGIIKEQGVRAPKLEEALNQFPFLLETLNPTLGSFSIDLPLLDKSKSEVIKIGHKLHVPFGNTWSCLESGPLHCGVCSQCNSRIKAFKVSKVTDPTEYKKG